MRSQMARRAETFGRLDDLRSAGEMRTVESAVAPIAFVRLIALVCISFLAVSGGLEQLQMFLWGGQILFSSAILKIVLALMVVVAILLRGRFEPPLALPAIITFVAYLAFDGIYLIFGQNLSVKDLLQSYNGYYGLLLLAPFAGAAGFRISEKVLIRILLFIFAICAFVAIAQYVVNLPIVPTSSADGTFNVLVWNRSPHIRVFSVFSAPDLLGCFAAFMAALATAMFFQPGRRFLAIAVFSVAIAVCYMTVVRTALLQCVFSVISAFVFCTSRKTGWQKFLPFLWLFLGSLTLVFAFFRSQSGGVDASLTDTSTFMVRLFEWRYYLGEYSSASGVAKLFGLGIFQGGHVDSAASVVPIDNIYIVALMHIGFIGLVVTVILLWSMSSSLARIADVSKSPLAIAVSSFWSVVWVNGLTQNFTFYFAAIFLFVSVSSIPQAGIIPTGREAEESHALQSPVDYVNPI